MIPSSGGPISLTKRNRWRHFQWPFAVVVAVVLSIAVWRRGSWWPVPFQSFARQALARRESEKALQWLDWATFLAPEDGDTEFLRARAYRRIGNFSESLAALDRGKELQPNSERFQREEWLCQAQSGQLNKVSRHVSKLLSDPRGESEEINEALLLGCFRTSRFVEANQILQSWVKEQPTHARPYLFRAKLSQLKSRSVDAIIDLRKAVELEPDNIEAIFELASTLQSINEFKEAIPLFERVVDAPRIADHVKVGLAVCLRSQGDTRRIRELLLQAVKLAPGNPRALCELGRLDLETGHYPDAVTRLKEAVRVAPRDDECHFVLAEALVANGTSEQARPHFEFAQKTRDDLRQLIRFEALLAKNPQNVDAMVRVGSILLETSDSDEGITRLLAALEIEPNQPIARRRLADHFARLAKTNPEFHKYEKLYRDPP